MLDFLIVGQGIAGSTLALRLMERGASVMVIDSGSGAGSSRVAAGLYNPVVFRKITLGWRAKAAIEEARQFYYKQQGELGSRFMSDAPMYRIHGSEAEARQWKLLQGTDGVGEFLEPTQDSSLRPWLNQPFGGAIVKHAGFIDTGLFLSGIRQMLESKSLLVDSKFDFSKLQVAGGQVEYEGINARSIVFCEGAAGAANPFFPDLPFNPAKGEVLTVEVEGVEASEIINGPVYGVPVGKSIYRVGSSYAWNQPNAQPTAEKRAEILGKLQGIVRPPVKVLDHQAGIRPTVKDRRPLAGFHPSHKNVAIFNGLGTKGVLMAPLLSIEMANLLTRGIAVPEDYSINRVLR